MLGAERLINHQITIINKEKKELFVLGTGHIKRSMSAQYLYEMFSVQWWEPAADNYIKLVRCAPDIIVSQSYKHFTWQQVVDFAEINRGLLDYRTKGSGDWKYVKEGASGYLLVEIGGRPYWADAVGQIPFAVGCFKDVLGSTVALGSKEVAVKYTLSTGQQFHDGNPLNFFSTSPVKVTNEYDNHFVLRGALWASERYDVKRIDNPFEEEDKPLIEFKVSKSSRNPSASKLSNPISYETAKKYGLNK